MTPHDATAVVSHIGFWPRMHQRGSELSKRMRIAFRRNPLGALALFLTVSMALMAVFAPQIATHDPYEINVPERLQPPSAKHLFGTDATGRDVFSRVMYGSRISLRVAVMVIVIAGTIGGVIGATAGYLGGLASEILMRITDVVLAFPTLVLALAVNAALGPGLESAMLAISMVWWTGYARMIRAQVLAAKNNLYVDAARSIGASTWRVVVRHILPNCINPTIVQATLDAGYVVLTTAGLSFIGLGAQPPTPEWGFMVSAGRKFMLDYWWWPTFPGLFITLTVIGFNMLGDFLRDLLDPRLRGRGVGA
jgi:peptide/nickel transport system permease protein